MTISKIDIETGNILDLDVPEGNYNDLTMTSDNIFACVYSDHETREQIQIIDFDDDGSTEIKIIASSGIRIGDDIYVKDMCRPVPFQIQVRDNMNKYRAQSNFESLLFNSMGVFQRI